MMCAGHGGFELSTSICRAIAAQECRDQQFPHHPVDNFRLYTQGVVSRRYTKLKFRYARSNSYKGEDMTNASFDDEHLPPEPPPEEEPAPRRRFQQEEPKRYGEFRQPPADREAEQGVLGAMLLSPHTVMEE